SSSDHSSSDYSSSDHSPTYHSSSGYSTSDRTLFRHTSPVTTIVDLSTPSRFVYPSPARTSHGSEAFRRWRSALLSTMYLPTTSESSARDSSSESSARPFCKRCRSPAATMPLPIPAPRALVPTRADLLPPRKRFRDSYSSEDSIEEYIDADVLADIKTDVGVDAGIGMEVGVEVVSEDEEEYEAESSARGTTEIRMYRVIKPVVADDIVEPTSEDYLDLELYDHIHEIPVDRITNIEAGHRQLEAKSLIASEERANLFDHVAALERSNTRL
ncbi:hypothetical protein Tco_1258041, partial [Tanacetum coccineum]